MGSSLRRSALALLVLVPLLACGQPNDEGAIDSNVEELSSDGFAGEDFDGVDLDGLGADPEPMIADDEIDALDAVPEQVADVEAEDLLDAADPLDEEIDAPMKTLSASAKGAHEGGGTTAKPKPRCKKRLHATFAIYTYLANDLASNGCWVPERTTQDDDYRACHSDGEIERSKGSRFFYDDTNPRNALSTEKARVARCAKGADLGFEYLAYRDVRWRIVRAPHVAAYFAELYTDDTRIDDLWYDRGVYRGNATLAKHTRVAPMLNVAPYPPRYTPREIEKEILKVCAHVKNHGFIGLYEWHFPLSHDSPYLAAVEKALNRCTRR